MDFGGLVQSNGVFWGDFVISILFLDAWPEPPHLLATAHIRTHVLESQIADRKFAMLDFQFSFSRKFLDHLQSRLSTSLT